MKRVIITLGLYLYVTSSWSSNSSSKPGCDYFFNTVPFASSNDEKPKDYALFLETFLKELATSPKPYTFEQFQIDFKNTEDDFLIEKAANLFFFSQIDRENKVKIFYTADDVTYKSTSYHRLTEEKIEDFMESIHSELKQVENFSKNRLYILQANYLVDEKYTAEIKSSIAQLAFRFTDMPLSVNYFVLSNPNASKELNKLEQISFTYNLKKHTGMDALKRQMFLRDPMINPNSVSFLDQILDFLPENYFNP